MRLIGAGGDAGATLAAALMAVLVPRISEGGMVVEDEVLVGRRFTV